MRGFTLVEALIASSILLLIVGTAATAIATDKETHRVLVGQLGPEMKAQNALRRIEAELRLASIWAEDLDHDGALDPDEDANGNGVLDSAFRIGEGANDAAVEGDSIRFNRRIDERDEDGDLLATGVFSDPVTYRLDADRLVRESGPDTAVLAAFVTNLAFRREGNVVTVSFDLQLPPRVYRTERRTYVGRVLLRN